jgi:uncharacterized protein
VPALILGAIHAILIGSRYLGGLTWSWQNQLQAGLLGIVVLGVLLIRSRSFWSLLSIERFYASPHQPKVSLTKHAQAEALGKHQ